MRKNLIEAGHLGADGRRYLPDDWYQWGIPANVVLAASVYISTSYGFAEFRSRQQPGMVLGNASGCYNNPHFITGPESCITVGDFSVLSGNLLICNRHIAIGSHCMLAWGSIVTDTWLGVGCLAPAQRRALLEQAAHTPTRYLAPGAEPAPVVLEDNSWIGFGAVVMPGVRVGRGAIVASKTVVFEDVPAYAIVAGSPARIVRRLEPDDDAEARAQAFREYLAG